MNLENFYSLNYAWLILAVLIFLALVVLKIRAPYGRHANEKWGKMIANHWGWVLDGTACIYNFSYSNFYGATRKRLADLAPGRTLDIALFQ